MLLTKPYLYARRYLPISSQLYDSNETIAMRCCIPSRQQLKHIVALSMLHAGLKPKARLSIAWVDSVYSQQLNLAYRAKDKPTNILSFSADAYGQAGVIVNLGELAICLPVVVAEAGNQNKAISAHITHLVVHGVLHLLGYEHELGDAQAQEMESIEVKVLVDLGFSNPYQL